MIQLIKSLFALLTPPQRRRFYSLQALVILMAFTEIIGIASIVPFMALVGDISLLQGETAYARLYQASGLQSPQSFLFLVGLGVLAALSAGALLSTVTIWRLSMFATRVGTEIGDRLYRHYMHQSWLFHTTHSSAQLTKQISTEALRVTSQILQPLMQLNSRVILTLFIAVGILLYNPWVALVAMGVFGGAYVFLYKVVRGRLQRNGRLISALSTSRFRLMNEGFGGIKDVTLLGRQADLVNRFEATGDEYAYAYGTNSALAQVPRYFMELLAFGSIIALVLFLMQSQRGNLGLVLPMLSVYALAGFKLLPALQIIYSSVAVIKGGQGAFEAIRDDLQESQQPSSKAAVLKNTTLQPRDAIELRAVTFSYPGKAKPALNGLNLRVKVNSTIGIVGPSGSGKSTAIDLLLGLIEPSAGHLIVDGEPVVAANRRAWQDSIGYVPQSIFLSEGSIAENVAFGVPSRDIDREQVAKALRLAHLDELVDSLPMGMDTTVGERGIQLSGGQRQRIGIARALYHDASVLVFDEATSALDGLTEKMIMDAISDFSGKKTIVMIAHRLKTVQKCDVIFYLQDGVVVDSGSYQELVQKNPGFKRMAEHS